MGSDFTKGWHELGNGQLAYLQPSGTWGYSNAGLIVDSGDALLVDTLFDQRLTAEMLRELEGRFAIPVAQISTLVNTHANGDHTYGNSLITSAQIIASEASMHEMQTEDSPEYIAAIMKQTEAMGDLGIYLKEIFGAFNFDEITPRLPDKTFTNEHVIDVGDKKVHLIEVGPAHTSGDVIVYVPTDKAVYTGDILFVDGTPVMWAGPVGNWLKACDRILAMDVETIIPGHGPVTDKAGVRSMQSYLRFLEKETRERHAVGMKSWDIAQDIAANEFDHWSDAERIAVTVDTICREIEGDQNPRNVTELFSRMMQLDKRSNPNRYDPCCKLNCNVMY